MLDSEMRRRAMGDDKTANQREATHNKHKKWTKLVGANCKSFLFPFFFFVSTSEQSLLMTKVGLGEKWLK
jgi:hypothetical protein